MPVHPNSLKNLEKGQGYFKRTTKEAQKKIAKMGAEVSNKVQAEDRDVIRFFEKAMQAKVTDEETLVALEQANLPPTLVGRMALLVVLKAATDPAMLKVLLEAIGILKGKQTNVTVNNNPDPLASYSDEEIRSAIDKLKKKV